jgi:hypothetical protein
MRPAGAGHTGDRRRNARGRAGNGSLGRDSRPETHLKASAAIETERNVVTTQISALARARARGRRAPVRITRPGVSGAGSEDRAYAAGGVHRSAAASGPSSWAFKIIGLQARWQAGLRQRLDSWSATPTQTLSHMRPGLRIGRSSADFPSADARLIVWRPRRFAGCLGVLGIVLSRRCRAGSSQGPRRPRRWE